jgi:hypothetical protein
LIVSTEGGLEADAVRWTGRFYKGGVGPIESFAFRVYEGGFGAPADIIFETLIDDFESERLIGNDFFYSADISRLGLTAGAVVWLEIQAKAPAVPQWGVLAIQFPETTRNRLLRAPELGVFRWASFPWFEEDGDPSHCAAFVDPAIQNPDSTGGHFPGVDFADPIIRPNPTTGFVRISFSLPATVHLDAGIFDIQGRRIRTLANETRADGTILLFWDGRSDARDAVPSGVYFLGVDVNSREYFRRKILLLRVKSDG